MKPAPSAVYALLTLGLTVGPVAALDPASGFKELTKQSTTLVQQLSTLRTKVEAASRQPLNPDNGAQGTNRARVAWVEPCCAAAIRDVRSSLAAVRTSGEQLQGHFREQKQARWVAEFGDVQAFVSNLTTMVDEIVAAPSAGAALPIAFKLSAGGDGLRTRIQSIAPCCAAK